LEYDLFDLSTVSSIMIEQQDVSFGQNFQEMEIYVSLVDNNFTRVEDANGDPIPDENGNDQFINRDNVAEVLYQTIPAASFGVSETGLPSYGFSIAFDEAISVLGLNESQFGLAEGQYTGGDIVRVRLLARMLDGSEWSVAQANNNITGGAYFSSPFQYSLPIVCSVEEGLFTGDYEASYVGYAGGFSDFFTLGGSSTITLVDGPSSTSRSFDFDYNNFGIGGTMTIDLICDRTVPRDFDLGASCDGGDISTVGSAEPFDIADDSSFSFTVVETDDGGCGFGSGGVITIEMTKL
ncbi:MAG: hypothetical protein AAFN93_28820, partial [Bacteroidota bacterium]